MTNHVHFLMTPSLEDSISKVMQSLGRRYVQYYNDTYSRTGTLWEGRYKATLIDPEQYLLTCYPWSSYHYNARGKEDSLISPQLLYKRLGGSPGERQKAYRQLFRTRLAESAVEEIREATNKSWVLGSDRFKAKIEKLTARQAAPKARGGDRKSKSYRKSKINRV